MKCTSGRTKLSEVKNRGYLYYLLLLKAQFVEVMCEFTRNNKLESKSFLGHNWLKKRWNFAGKELCPVLLNSLQGSEFGVAILNSVEKYPLLGM